MKTILKGNETLALAVSQANVKFIPVYPITPQTSIIESLADMITKKKIDAYYVPMESEHSVMASCIGASNCGVRVFTATSGQGLLYMHELLHWASGGRLPIVMGVVNRAVAPGWNIWMDQTDSVSQRDTGWIQIYASHHQELYDHLFIAYKLSEQVLLPSMIIQDAFFLSHTMGHLVIEDQNKINNFLNEKPNIPFAFDFDNPCIIGSLSDPSNYMEFRYLIEQAFGDVKNILKEIYEDFNKSFKRNYSIYDEYLTDDADILLFLSGTVYETAHKSIEELRKEGIKIGIVKIRFLRPFFKKELLEIIKGRERIIILDRNISFGMGGVFSSEIQSALYGQAIPIQSVIAGLGGRDITVNTLKKIIYKVLREEVPSIYWEGEIYE